MRVKPLACVALAFACLPLPAQDKNAIAPAVNGTWLELEAAFIAAAQAMPSGKYSFAPSQGAFAGVRTFAEQIKHAACANFAFFNEIEGKEPPADCAHGGPDAAKTKAELVRYLQSSFEYADKVLATITTANALDRADGPYAAPSTKIGLVVTAVRHASDHYGQIVEYLRMNGIAPPAGKESKPSPRAP